MIKPKYGLLQKVYFCDKGKIQEFQVETISYAKDGIWPFTTSGVYYADEDQEFVVPEENCFVDRKSAINFLISELQQELEKEKP